MAYGIIYRYLFDSRQGYAVEVNIAKKDYTGGVTTRALGRAPVLRRDNSDNISGTSLEIYAECQQVGEYEQFYTSSADEFKVMLYRDGIQIWSGFVTPELYSEPDIPTPYDVRIIATDGLGELKRFDYDLSGAYTLREHLIYMLEKTGIEREILFSSAMAVTTSELGYSSNFLLDAVKVSLDHEIGETCYDVLQHLLAAFNAGITLYTGRWFIYRETDMLNLVSAEGLKAYQGSVNKFLPVVPFGSMTTNKWWPIGSLSAAMIPAKKSFRLTASYNYYENLFKDDQWAKISEAYYDEDEGAYALPDAGAEISQKVTFSPNDFVRDRLVLKLRARNTGVGDVEAPLNIRVQMYGRVASAAVTTHYLSGTVPSPSRPNPAPYAWKTTEATMEFSLPVPSEGETADDAQDIEVVIPLYTGVRAFAYAHDMKVILSNAAGTYGIYVYDISLSQYDRAEGVKAQVNIENNAREKASDIDLHIADTSQLNNGSKWLMPGVPTSPTGLYFIEWAAGVNTGKGKRYIDAMAADYAIKIGSVRRQYTGRLHVGDSQIPALFLRDGVYYFPRSYSYDLYEDEMEVDLISVPGASVEFIQD